MRFARSVILAVFVNFYRTPMMVTYRLMPTMSSPRKLVPAKAGAGTQGSRKYLASLGSRLRGNDDERRRRHRSASVGPGIRRPPIFFVLNPKRPQPHGLQLQGV
jgi:hypothetical protein